MEQQCHKGSFPIKSLFRNVKFSLAFLRFSPARRILKLANSRYLQVKSL